ncbi:MAG: Na+/H+ antiporter subunit G [Deltaproteobacteria bacterium]|jgi:multicomponent Na+:H+ antiporter subunit G|nr:Na+/H+ antiporter subunit G [Deltaproteobacteria bacterium]
MIEVFGYILIAVGIVFDICGCIGLVRFPDVYNRLQAATKCVTLGTILLLFGVAFVSQMGATTSKSVVCAIFILITSPTAAHAIAKGAHSAGVKLWNKSIVDKYEEEVNHHNQRLNNEE